jgi:hypothetical protein
MAIAASAAIAGTDSDWLFAESVKSIFSQKF